MNWNELLLIFKQKGDDDQKKMERAKRFGMIIPEVEEAKKRLRAEKFGTNLKAPSPQKKIKQ